MPTPAFAPQYGERARRSPVHAQEVLIGTYAIASQPQHARVRGAIGNVRPLADRPPRRRREETRARGHCGDRAAQRGPRCNSAVGSEKALAKKTPGLPKVPKVGPVAIPNLGPIVVTRVAAGRRSAAPSASASRKARTAGVSPARPTRPAGPSGEATKTRREGTDDAAEKRREAADEAAKKQREGSDQDGGDR